ncbi:hypothetical protein PHYBOEH_002078 [Phytophthora boehmeriae]|uniref:BZIP domain-containing protein n=1 Tax=Phytophthora boehmeriae TaxID=109152 RepID=A0A8T1X7F8_9STRA|nr:hypothetical protein PHYBOEH_002078 [Phytophthora boehmeriae]
MASLISLNCGFTELRFALAKANAQVLTTTDVTDKREIRALKKRLQDRLYQRKHRAKREHKIRALQGEVSALHCKIARLYCDLHRRKAEAESAEVERRQQQQHPVGSLLDHTVSLVSQFFCVYQNGYSLSLATQQERFLHSVLAVNVEGADISSADAFVQQWRLYGQHFALFALEPQSWKAQSFGDCVMVEVEVMIYIRFHRQTIGMLFPALKRGAVNPDLAQPLVTGTTAVAGTYTFVVDRTGFVSALLVNLQLLETLRRVLGSVEIVACLSEGVRIAFETGTITIT